MNDTAYNKANLFGSMIQVLQNAEWCQNKLAMDERGNKVPPYDPRAKMFCAQGALMRHLCANNITNTNEFSYAIALVDIAFRKVHRISLTLYNDDYETTKQKLIVKLQQARDFYIKIAHER